MGDESKKVKVLVLSNFYYPHWTGIVQYAKALAEGLVEQGFRVTVWTSRHNKDLNLNETIEGVEIKRSPAWFRISRTQISPGFMWGMGQQIRNCDEVVAFLPMTEVLEAIFWAKIFRKKIFLIHNGDLKLTRGGINRLIEIVFWLTTYIAIKMCNGLIVNTIDYAKNSTLLKRFPEKWIEIVPPFKKIAPDLKTNKLIRTKLNDAKHVVGFAGRFVEEKGFDILLKAIPEVIKQLPGTKFAFAGETNVGYENTFQNNFQSWQQQAKHLVSFGKLEHAMMGSFYSNCEMFVISSRSDFFPFTQAEAMLAGLPIITTDIPGARWPVKVTGAGEIVKTEDPRALARGIIKVAGSRKRYADKYPKVEEYFDYNDTMQKYVRLFKKEK